MFHEYHGKKVILSQNNQTAKRKGRGNNVVFSGESLRAGQPFTVKAEGSSTTPTCMGVTSVDPSSQPKISYWTTDLGNSWVLEDTDKWQDGEKVGKWEGDLQDNTGQTASILWDGQDVFFNGNSTPVFTGVPGPLWAVIDLGWLVSKISVLRPGEEGKTAKRTKGNTTCSGQEEPCVNKETSKPKVGQTSSGAKQMGSKGPLTQSFEASGIVIPRRACSITCPYWEVSDRFIDSLGLPDIYFDPEHDKCFCMSCILARGDDLYYSRGVPPKSYGLPGGWCRFGLKVPAKAHGMETFAQWHIAFHGTLPGIIRSIIESDNLLMPGDYTIEGIKLAPPADHFNEKTKPNKDFDVKQVFVSPTIVYAGLDTYAKPQSWTDPETGKCHQFKVALQVRIKPDSYKVGKETVGLGSKRIDAKFDNNELEWSTKIRGATILQGILVKFY